MTIGVDMGATVIIAGIIESGVIYRKISEAFPPHKTEEEGVNLLIGVIDKLMNSNIKGIGISVPSVVDSVEGIVYNSARNLPVWKEVHLKSILERKYRVPVNINNDCNCLAFAERYYGEATPYRNVVTVKMSAGLGAGVIINDVLYNGWNTCAGEIGCLPYLDKTYEEYCALNFFKKYKTTGYVALLRAENNDAEALKIWNEYGKHVGNLIKAILFTYDPQAIILAGELSKAFDYFSKSMYKELSTFPYSSNVRQIKILVSSKEDIGLLGAAALVP
jgi:glucokinase